MCLTACGQRTGAQTQNSFFKEASIQTQTIYDKDNIKVNAATLDMLAAGGPTLSFQVTNHMARSVTLQFKDISTNNVMSYDTNGYNAPAGLTTTELLRFDPEQLKVADIETFGDITLSISITDTNTGADIADSEPITIQTSQYGKYAQKYDFNGVTVLDDANVRIQIGRRDEPSARMGKQIYLYIENKSSVDITLSTKDVQVNGFPLDTYFIKTISAQMRACEPLNFLDSDLIKNGIMSVNDLAIGFQAISINGTILDTGQYKIAFTDDDTPESSETAPT